MLFNSFQFVFFFIAITLLYFILPHKYRWFLLLAGSCYFYMAFVPIYILILGFTIVIDYFAGIFLEDASGKRKKWFLVASLFANIGVLAVFKYYNFLNENLTILLSGLGKSNPIPYLSILLPIGLSFHTFQAMSYTIEVYRGHQKAERNFGIYALYVMFYPQLVAGPIERPQNLLHQFYEKHSFEIDRVVSGLKIILWGFFKKLVIADRLALYVNAAYNNADHHSGQTLILATIFFAFQIYCDFSGYSDIAIGSARLTGTTFALIVGHTVVTIPFVIVTTLAGLRHIDRNLEVAATVMGASKWTVLRRVTLPLLRPTILVASLFAFLISFDEVVISYFIANVQRQTLPVRMYSSIHWEISPVLAAISALLTGLSLVVCLFVAFLQKGRAVG